MWKKKKSYCFVGKRKKQERFHWLTSKYKMTAQESQQLLTVLSYKPDTKTVIEMEHKNKPIYPQRSECQRKRKNVYQRKDCLFHMQC